MCDGGRNHNKAVEFEWGFVGIRMYLLLYSGNIYIYIYIFYLFLYLYLYIYIYCTRLTGHSDPQGSKVSPDLYKQAKWHLFEVDFARDPSVYMIHSLVWGLHATIGYFVLWAPQGSKLQYTLHRLVRCCKQTPYLFATWFLYYSLGVLICLYCKANLNKISGNTFLPFPRVSHWICK